MGIEVLGPSIDCFLQCWFQNDVLPPGEQRVFDRYYRSYKDNFNPYIRSHYSSQVKEVEHELKAKPGARVLEIGCGCGTESLWFGLCGADVLGIDITMERLSVAEKRLNHLKDRFEFDLKVKFELMSVFDVRNNDFDIVWMEQAFHHIEPRSRLLDFLPRLLKPGGCLVISECNGYNPMMQLLLLRRRGLRTVKNYTDVKGTDHMYGDERITTPRKLHSELKERGFVDINTRYFRVFPNWKISPKLGFIEKYIPGWFAPAYSHFNTKARKPG